MKTHLRNLLLNFIVLLIVVGLILLLPGVSKAISGDIYQESLTDDPKRLHITADNLVAYQNNQQIIFSGHVTAIYDLKKITSEELHVFYNDQPGAEKFGGLSHSSIKSIVASGSVKIEFENKTAECDKAVYTADSNLMVLTGREVRLQSENNFITGNKISIYQDSGQITVDGNDEKRVNAVFQPEKKNTTVNEK